MQMLRSQLLMTKDTWSLNAHLKQPVQGDLFQLPAKRFCQGQSSLIEFHLHISKP